MVRGITDVQVAHWNSFRTTGKLPRGQEDDLKIKPLGSVSEVLKAAVSRAKSFHIEYKLISFSLTFPYIHMLYFDHVHVRFISLPYYILDLFPY